ncbi:MAG: ABC transporter ATP-binding protein [Alphaproteobacteria bacterium]
MPGITLSNITKSFGDTVVLRGVDLSFAAGEFISLVGPSGCGKTTLLRIIAGLETCDLGTVVIDDADVTAKRAADRDIAFVFQNYALYPHLTVEQNMAVPLFMRRMNALERTGFIGRLMPGSRPKRAAIKAEVKAAADLLSIGHLLDRRPSQLSGGQRQRVALGRAIVRHPRAFLMDEPLSNLDAALRADMRRELVDLHRRVGVTTIYVTHDQAEAMTMSDRVAVMLGGVVQQFATPKAIYEQPANVEVAAFIGSPRINLIAVKADSRGSILWGGTRLIGEPSAAMTLGLRPEHLGVKPDGAASMVRHVEFLGPDVLVHAETVENGNALIVRFAPEAWSAFESHERLLLGPIGPVLLFDAQGRRVPSAASGRMSEPAVRAVG